MATVMGGVSYGLYFLTKVCIITKIGTPTTVIVVNRS